jgi:hypothetical protein
METIKVRVENGKVVGPAPRGIPEGTELELRIADPGDEMTDDELAALNQALEAGWRSVEAGRFRPARDVISEFRSGR